MGNRRKLMLPPAQVGEAELEEIVKIGLVGQQAKLLVDRGGDEASGQLVGEYSDLDKARMARTPRTAPECKFSVSSIYSCANSGYFS